MKNFYVYDPTTFMILRQGICLDEDFKRQNHDGGIVVEGELTNENMVVDGKPVYVPPPPPTPEEISLREEAAFTEEVKRKAPDILLDMENRIRALEKKPLLTKEDFKVSIKAR